MASLKTYAIPAGMHMCHKINMPGSVLLWVCLFKPTHFRGKAKDCNGLMSHTTRLDSQWGNGLMLFPSLNVKFGRSLKWLVPSSLLNSWTSCADLRSFPCFLYLPYDPAIFWPTMNFLHLPPPLKRSVSLASAVKRPTTVTHISSYHILIFMITSCNGQALQSLSDDYSFPPVFFLASPSLKRHVLCWTYLSPSADAPLIPFSPCNQQWVTHRSFPHPQTTMRHNITRG